ncbi:MAG: hypothetical protein Q7J73_09955 [Dehalococcoidales bacterium]|nr:hypothetical protein [Dehalococcoidales bacterium]
MKKQIQLWVRGLLVAFLVVPLLMMGCSSPTVTADKAASPALVAAPGPAASSPRGGLPQEGIQVHGHWTIEVRNPDGTLAERREFENALGVEGDRLLSQVLGRTQSVGGWAILFNGNAFQIGGFASVGWILENGGLNAPTGPGYFPTLTIDVPIAGTNADKLVLSGTATAQFDGNIVTVLTRSNRRPNTEAPSSTYGGDGAVIFTHTTLATPINLLAGQQVLVTVVISFS